MFMPGQDKFTLIEIAETLERIRYHLRTVSGRKKVNKAIRVNWRITAK